MPIGLPGMEAGKPETYEVVLFGPEVLQRYGRFLGCEPVWRDRPVGSMRFIAIAYLPT